MKTAIITGASGGIGIKTVEKFIKNGYFVLAVYNKNLRPLKELKERLEKEGYIGTLFTYSCDLTSGKNVDALFTEIEKSFKHIDAVINIAGKGLIKLITETKEKEWEDLFNTNVKSAYLVTNKALKSMIEKKSGAIVNVSSMWGKVGASLEVCYSATKSAMIGYTLSLSKELAPSGIRVNCVCPGVIDTKMNEVFSKTEIKELAEKTPLNRIGEPSEVADAIFFLASKNASFITGQILSVDGGFSL